MADSALSTHHSALSTSSPASRLLEYLKRWAGARERAKTDAAIAAALGIPVREIVDLADELLAAGHLVVAEVTAPHGRWLLAPTADLAPARHYANSLGRRGVSILLRRKHLRRAIARADAARLIDSTGQRRLFA